MMNNLKKISWVIKLIKIIVLFRLKLFDSMFVFSICMMKDNRFFKIKVLVNCFGWIGEYVLVCINVVR